jgi:hypothetical protein
MRQSRHMNSMLLGTRDLLYAIDARKSEFTRANGNVQ